MSVIELRVAITTEEFEQLVAFYQDGLGLNPGNMWSEYGRGQLFHASDIQVTVENAQKYGARLVHEPILTPWDDLNARIESPDGLQITLFQLTSAENH